MLSRNDLSPAVKALIKNNLCQLPSMGNDDIMHTSNAYFYMRPFFADKTAKVLHNKVYSLVHQRNEELGHEGLLRFIQTLGIKSADNKYGYKRVADLVNFFGFSATEDNLDLAMANLINTIDDLAERDYITGAMAPLSIIELAPQFGKPRTFCIVSYIAIKYGAPQTWVDNNLKHVTFKEGSIPNEAK